MLGLTAGFYGRWADSVIMRLIDLLLAFPSILLALGVVAVLGGSLPNVMIAVGIAGIPSSRASSAPRSWRCGHCRSWRPPARSDARTG